MNKDEIISGLKRVYEIANSKGISVELAIYGGAALILGHEARPITKDVDAIFIGDKREKANNEKEKVCNLEELE